MVLKNVIEREESRNRNVGSSTGRETKIDT